MDVAMLSMGMSQMKLAQQVSAGVAKMAMDTAKVNADGLLRIMEQSVNPHLGAKIDIKV